jgi:hypothetical protein
MKRSVIFAAAIAALAASAANATDVSGKVEEYVETGLRPAEGILVSLVAQESRFGPVNSGSDGRYYLVKVPPGAYVLEIWPDPSMTKGNRFSVEIPDAATTALDPVLVNTLWFESPHERAELTAGTISASGRHSFPANAPIWIALANTTTNNRRFVARVTPRSDSTWVAERIQLDPTANEIQAVLVTAEADRQLSAALGTGGATQRAELPEGSRLLAARAFTIGQ